MDEVPDLSYFEEKASIMQNALKSIQYHFDDLERIYKDPSSSSSPKETPEFFIELIKDRLDKVNEELIELETYAERLRVDRPRNTNTPRVSGTNRFR